MRSRLAVAVAVVIVACSGCRGSRPGHVDTSVNDDATTGQVDEGRPDTRADAQVDGRSPDTRADGLVDECRPDTRGNSEACVCSPQCASGFCVDGFCCDSTCDGLCMSCHLATAPGICTAIPAGVRPRTVSDCIAEDSASCRLDGTCDGAGACRKHQSGTVCKAGTCDADAVVGPYLCDGAGTCKLGASMVCAPFKCDPTTNQCFPTCGTNAECVSGTTCRNGACFRVGDPNCAAAPECPSGHCNDGVCCNTICTGPCRACNLPGTFGSCAPVPAGIPDDDCPTCGLCDGQGGYLDGGADAQAD